MIAVIVGTVVGTLVAFAIWEVYRQQRLLKRPPRGTQKPDGMEGGIDRTSNPGWKTKALDERAAKLLRLTPEQRSKWLRGEWDGDGEPKP